MINLLPPKEKQILLQEKQFREALILGIVAFLSLLCLGLILFSIEINLKSQLLVQQIVLEQKDKELEISEIGDLEEKVEFLNQTFLKLNSLYQDGFYLTDVLKEVSGAVGSDLHLTNLSYNEEKRQITVSGFSPNRAALTVFKENLEKETSFKEIYFPPLNWIKPIDIDFSVSFKIK